MDIENRGDIEDSIDILSGLILVYEEDNGNDSDDSYHTDEEDDGDKTVDTQDNDEGQNLSSSYASRYSDDGHTGSFTRRFNSESKVRLAHFSIKEYLDSERILEGTAKDFHLDAADEHRFLAQSCLTYLMHYSNDTMEIATAVDQHVYPLLYYSANTWYYHSSRQSDGDMEREVRLLTGAAFTHCWLLHDVSSFGRYELLCYKESTLNGSRPAQAIYFASYLGLQKLTELLLAKGADANAWGWYFGSALKAASSRGHKDIVELLLARGADVNAQGGTYGNVLHAACEEGYKDTVELLLARRADVNTSGGFYGSALQVASYSGYKDIVELLLAKGADVNAQGGFYGNALQASVEEDNIEIVERLLTAGADVNAQGGKYGNALQAAEYWRHEEIADILLAAGAVPIQDD